MIENKKIFNSILLLGKDMNSNLISTGEILNTVKKVVNRRNSKKRVIKRFYNVSNKLFIKNFVIIGNHIIPISDKILNVVVKNFMTEHNLSKIVKEQNILVSKKIEEVITEKVINHRAVIDGVNVDEENNINLEIFTPFTSKPEHDIDLILSLKQKIMIMGKGINFKMPTLKIAENNKEGIKVTENFSIKNLSIEKKIMSQLQQMKLKEKDIIEMPKGLGQEIREKKEGMMEKLGWKDYEFFQKTGKMYGVHKDYIEKIGNIIVNVNFEKAKSITLGDYALISKEIANNPELNEFINIDSRTKEMYENNYKIWSKLKKD